MAAAWEKAKQMDEAKRPAVDLMKPAVLRKNLVADLAKRIQQDRLIAWLYEHFMVCHPPARNQGGKAYARYCTDLRNRITDNVRNGRQTHCPCDYESPVVDLTKEAVGE